MMMMMINTVGAEVVVVTVITGLSPALIISLIYRGEHPHYFRHIVILLNIEEVVS